ncbi:MAG TPA: hypothetical protein VKB36_16930 [Vicinamibacterales bacterium]|nr:hypothetical protein [Vicinamibacterales bacterium]
MKPAFSFALASALLALPSVGTHAQSGKRPSSHIVIPLMANATKPDDLDFQGGECELDASGTTMECVFEQAFLTTTSVAPDTCLITTNRYQRTFKQEDTGTRVASTSSRWISTEGPAGNCGVLDVATLQYDGGIKWTMEMRKVVTKKDASCRAIEGESETMSWQNLRRPLPCRFVQPGGLGR